MTRDPKTVTPETLAASVLQLTNATSITSALVVDKGQLVGIVHLHDLLRIGAA
jgi:arabinose-5-phosphate isomerase